MIEKLNLEEVNNPGEATLKAFSILNQLVDAVNELEKHTDRMSCAILDLATPDGENKALKSLKTESKTPAENVQDEFAEQRKWIGKLCRFWDKDYKDCIYDILHHIDPNCVYKYSRRELGGGYSHCEPVKPDDDIIYKGGNNE